MRQAEGVLQAGALVDHLQQAVVGDDDQRVGVFLELADARLSGRGAARAFEGERPGHHTDGQRADFLGDLRHDAGCAGAGAAAHARGDKDHVAALEHLIQLVSRFLGRFAADFGVSAGAQAAGDLVANPHAGLRLGLEQRLPVGVDGDELDALQTFLDHAVDGIAPTSADSNDLDAGK